MTTEEAIEILTDYMEGSDAAEPSEFDRAVLLGIEALERLQEHRTSRMDITYRALPSETEKTKRDLPEGE